MEGITLGRNFHPGMIIPLYLNQEEAFPAGDGESRFRLVHVESGTGILRLNGYRLAIIAPMIFCLNDRDQTELLEDNHLQTRSFCFRPSVINSAFNDQIVHGSTAVLSPTEHQDLLCLRPFLIRSEEYFGQINIGPTTSEKITAFFDRIDQGLTLQAEEFWPCRSRSYFLEMLFQIERFFNTRDHFNEISIFERVNEKDYEVLIERVIMYLHDHYAERITVTELSKIFNLNRTSLTEKFYAATGLSIINYLIGLRLKLAMLILRDTTIPIADVMERVGFRDLPYFGRMFRRLTGYSPSEYRQQYCWMLKSG